MDVHVPISVTRQLRLRAVDVITAQEDDAAAFPDDQLLGRASELDRLLFTQDIRFKALAENWQRSGREFAGLIFAHQLRTSIGQLVTDLEIIAKASDPDDWRGMVEEIPLPQP